MEKTRASQTNHRVPFIAGKIPPVLPSGVPAGLPSINWLLI
jgi:hypothetical protein